jgi:hypothetical protein
VAWRSFEFIGKTADRVPLSVGLSALEETPSGQAKSLLMTAVPATT